MNQVFGLHHKLHGLYWNGKITIIINEPIEESIVPFDSKETPYEKNGDSSVKPDSTQAGDDKVELETPGKKAKRTTYSKPIPTMIIHTIVKGDTLWSIAKRYIDDPYQYVELAKLSNIKDPTRIYPGNQIRIIKYPE